MHVQIRSKFYRGRNGWLVIATGGGVSGKVSRVFCHSRTAAECIRAVNLAAAAGKLTGDRAFETINALLRADEFCR